jgi:4-hydroxythreonine-4-phosphate dehydrogenase
MSHFQNKPLVVSIGDPAGIGPDVILMAFEQRNTLNLPPFYVQGEKGILRERAKQLNLEISFQEIDETQIHEVASFFSSFLPVKNCGVPISDVQAGHINSDHASFVIQAIRSSIEDIHNSFASGIVTAPIHKGNLYSAGFEFPGHTEFLASLSRDVFGLERQPVMMLASDELRVVPVTIHVPFADVPSLLTKDLIKETTHILAKDLEDRFGIKAPHIIVTGLNPHAGEDGTLGRTEIEIIEPAVKDLCNDGLNVTGPYSADTCFHPRARANYDAAVTMYHDQGLIPIKTLSFDDGVNVTLGLPFIRTSPDHGTALDIAGTGDAKSNSFIAALKMAAQMRDHSVANLEANS